MSTDTIIEILRHHDNPCAVLERHAPLFEPFDLEAAIKYAQAHHARTPRVFTSLLVSGLNALAGKPCWHFNEEYTGPHQTRSTWGEYVSRDMLYHVGMPIMLAGEPHAMQAYYLDHSLEHSSVIILSLPLTQFHRLRTPPPFAHSEVYARCLAEGLNGVGGRISHDMERYLGRHSLEYSMHLEIPLRSVTPCMERLFELLRGSEIVASVEGVLVPGPLANKIGDRLGLSDEELHQWARCDYGDVYDEDDIPF